MSFDYFLSVINSHAVDYYQLYLKLIAIFPKDNVLFLPAELLFSDERRFIDILSNRSGIVFSPIENEVDSEKIKFQNIAMSSLSQRVLGLSSLLQRHEIFVTENQVLGRLHQSYNSFFVNFTRWLDQQLFGTRLYKKIEIQSAEVLSMYMESNGKLNKLIQEVDLCEFGYC